MSSFLLILVYLFHAIIFSINLWGNKMVAAVVVVARRNIVIITILIRSRS